MATNKERPERDDKLFDEFADAINEGDPTKLNNLLAAGAEPNICAGDKETPVLFAVRFAKPQMLKILLEAEANPDVPDEYNWSPLIQAAHDDRPDLVEILLKAGADPNVCPNKLAPLAMAIGHSERCAELIIGAGADVYFLPGDGWPFLMKAVNVKAEKAVPLLLEAGADPNAENAHGWNALMLAEYHGHDSLADAIRKAGGKSDPDRLELFAAIESVDLDKLKGCKDLNARDPWGKTPLTWVCSREEANTTLRPVFDFLMKSKVDLDAEDDEGLTALIYAAEGDDELVEILLKAGAGAKRGKGWSPLHTAARSGSVALTRAMLEAGANPNKGDQDKRPPIVWAAVQGFDEIVGMLIDAGADIDGAGKDRVTALIAASGKGHADVVRRLLDAGAKIDLQDYGLHRTALHHATKGDPAIVQMLLEAGADPLVKSRSDHTPVADAYSYNYDCAPPIQQKLTQMAMDAALKKQPPNARILAMMLAGQRKIAALADWAATGNAGVVRDLLNVGVSPDQHGAVKMPPLLEAVRRGHPEIVKVLVEAGANIKPGWGKSPLEFAIEEPQIESVIRLLLEAGAETYRIDPVALEPFRTPKVVAQADPEESKNTAFAAQFGDFDRETIRISQEEFEEIARLHFHEFQQRVYDKSVNWERLYIERPDDEVQLLRGAGDIDDSTQANFRRVTIDGIKADQVYLDVSNWSHSVVKNCKFTDSNFHDAMFSHGRTVDSKFTQCTFDRSDWSQRSISGSTFDSCNLRNVEFERSHLEKVKFKRCSMWEAVFSNAILTEVEFEHCDLRAAHLRGAVFKRCKFKGGTWAHVSRGVAEWIDCEID